MTVRLSTGARNIALNSGFAGAFDTNGRISFFNGTDPTDPNAAISGTLLATLNLNSDWAGTASGGVLTANSIANGTGAATGDTNYVVLWRSTDTALGSAAATGDVRIILTNVTTTGGGGEVEMSTITIANGGTVSVTSLTLTQPAA